MKKLVINNQLINYFEYSDQKGGPALLFLHGWRVDGSIWHETIKLMQSQDIAGSFYALDFPGFGGSPAPIKDFHLSDYCDIIEGFIKKLKLENVVLIGHSFGGRVAIKLSATHAELVTKLVLVDSAGLVLQKNQKTFMNIAAGIVKPFFSPKFMQPLRKSIYKAIGSEDYLATPRLQNVYVNVTKEDLSIYLSKITVPTLIVWGAQDRDTPLEYGQVMAKNISNSKLIIYPEAGHFAFSDNPQEFVKDIKEFIND